MFSDNPYTWPECRRTSSVNASSFPAWALATKTRSGTLACVSIFAKLLCLGQSRLDETFIEAPLKTNNTALPVVQNPGACSVARRFPAVENCGKELKVLPSFKYVERCGERSFR